MAGLLAKRMFGFNEDVEMMELYNKHFTQFGELRGKPDELVAITYDVDGTFSETVKSLLIDPLYPDYETWADWKADWKRVLAMLRVMWTLIMDRTNYPESVYKNAASAYYFLDESLGSMGYFKTMGIHAEPIGHLLRGGDEKIRSLIAFFMCYNPVARTEDFWSMVPELIEGDGLVNEMNILSAIEFPTHVLPLPKLYLFILKVFGRTLGSQILRYIENCVPKDESAPFAEKIGKKEFVVRINEIPDPIPDRIVPAALMLGMRFNHLAARHEFEDTLPLELEAQFAWEVQFDVAVSAYDHYQPNRDDYPQRALLEYLVALSLLPPSDMSRLFTDPGWGLEPLKVTIRDNSGKEIEWVGGNTMRPIFFQLCPHLSKYYRANERNSYIYDAAFADAYHDYLRTTINEHDKVNCVAQIASTWI
ncbi:bromodomain-like motif protein [Ranid herpesvirus 3]|uniref:Bromodomain-like motif protein n=1 Tax=Ranid herpesvirus 3 TaxID=1987509 RepID=A0A1X9T561_9VIRU|nr:bromodomain-like motif protein [Ranid herpesvirus 3]ARR28836.1 bromodomain-like motif protein [Ranid herpesvirus 3]